MAKYRLTTSQCERVVNDAALRLYRYCQKHGIHFLVTGSSGGLDSAVTLGIVQRACEIGSRDGHILVSVGLIMPCHSTKESKSLGKEACKRFGAEMISLDLGNAYDFVTDPRHSDNLDRKVANIRSRWACEGGSLVADWDKKIAQGNIKARLRMMLGTYHVAKLLGSGMVMSTDNLSEFWMAFWTLHGDVGDYGLIQNLMKGLELYEIAKYLDVPKAIIEAKPDDGLGVGNGDEDQLGAPYKVIDRVMAELISQGFDPDGEMSQLDHLPKISFWVNKQTIRRLARRSLLGSFKRKGGETLTREMLGLPSIQEVAKILRS